ncbi:gamma-glutamyltransferase [Pseudonocardia eucalypti]|uniref:Glutathione hydrolase proenzyme n=1 Tax=Pseudonocardia eucalypti TaxID=648755 RepID=A0ABP9RBV7_9PSEU|nr:gamma-glutamyltranspeptidase/glutathione hydrolase [Pseudonocardia eucalypti]
MAAAAGVVLSACTSAPPQQQPAPVDTGPAKQAEAIGNGGVVASVDPYASAIGLEVLRSGGNAVDAAVATAAALGVTEPYSAGIGGGGFFVYYDAASGKVSTLDGRETAPAAADANYFTENGKAIDFNEAVSSGLSVGVPGTPATWDEAARRWGTKPLADLLKPAAKLAGDGFVVDQEFRSQTEENAQRFAYFPATAQIYLPGGAAPAVGSTLRNPDLAATYDLLARDGVGAIYNGAIGAEIIAATNTPKTVPGKTVRAGKLAPSDLAGYKVEPRDPTHAQYRGLDVYGMAGSSSGGIAVAEALNILERGELRGQPKVDVLHRYLEATRLAFADRNRWVGDPTANDVPTAQLLSQEFADSRSCRIDPAKAAASPAGPGDPKAPAACPAPLAPAGAEGNEGHNTTHLTVADAKGNVVAYTLTIEQTGGSGMVVPGRGFILNNELTDFNFVPVTAGVPDPNLAGPSKRPRSSMSPTIVLDKGQPLLAVGSPGGATIITTVTQTLVNRVDLGMSLVDAIAAPRASQRNGAKTEAEPAFLAQPERADLEARGQAFTQVKEIGAAAGVERLPDGRWAAAAEKARRGGGSAMAVNR